MTSDTKASPSGPLMPYDVPFKILSEKQMEWVQFKARQKLLELKEEEEWKVYCKEQNFNEIEQCGDSSESPLNADATASKEAEKNLETVPAVKIIDHKKNSKDIKKPSVRSLSKSKGIQLETVPLSQVSHFQKTRLGSTLNFLSSENLKVLNVQKSSEDTVNFGNFDGEDKESATAPGVSTGRRIVRTINLSNLEDIDLPWDSNEMTLYPKVGRNVGFTLPYSLREQRYLARRAYLPSYSKPKIQSKRNPLPANKSTDSTNNAKRNSEGTTASRNVNPKFQNLSTSQTKNSRYQEKINSSHGKEVLNEKMKSTSIKAKKSGKREKEVARKVVEFVLNEILDEVILKVEHEEEVKRKSSMYSQLNSILQKLSDIESEESAIHHKWGTLIVDKLHEENAYVALPPAVVSSTLPKSLNPVQEKSTQSIMDEVFQGTVKNSEGRMENVISETAITKKKPCSQNPSNNRVGSEDVRCIINPNSTEADEQTVQLSKTTVPHNLNIEREVSVAPESLKRIYNYRKSFRQYLKQSSEMSKQHCHFWNVSTETADQILEECLQEIAEELCEIPSFLIADLYNQEFEHLAFKS